MRPLIAVIAALNLPSSLRIAVALLLLPLLTHAAQLDIIGPSGSGLFGTAVTVLPNGNFVVTDPGFDAPGPVTDVGAAYLYGPTGTLISTLTGSLANDRVGSSGHSAGERPLSGAQRQLER